MQRTFQRNEMLNFGAGKKKRKKEEKDRVVKKIGSFVDRLLLGFNDADVTRFASL